LIEDNDFKSDDLNEINNFNYNKKMDELNQKQDNLYDKYIKQSNKNLIKIFSLLIALFGTTFIINTLFLTSYFVVVTFFAETVVLSTAGITYTKKLTKKTDEIAKEINLVNKEITKLESEKIMDINIEFIKKSNEQINLDNNIKQKQDDEGIVFVDDSLNINFDKNKNVKRLNKKRQNNN